MLYIPQAVRYAFMMSPHNTNGRKADSSAPEDSAAALGAARKYPMQRERLRLHRTQRKQGGLKERSSVNVYAGGPAARGQQINGRPAANTLSLTDGRLSLTDSGKCAL